MTLAIILCFLWWTGTLIFAAWWSERRFQDGYHEGYQDACQWIEDHTGDIPVQSYFGDEP